MLINIALLYDYQGTLEEYAADDYIFVIGEAPNYYYQIISGSVKLNHFEGKKEFIHNIHGAGEAVCESLLFLDVKYPVNAVALSNCEIIKVPKKSFRLLLQDHQNVFKDIYLYSAERQYEKFIMTVNITSYSAGTRIKGTLDYFKNLSGNSAPYSYEVKLSRQQLAAITGMRVETVIRSLKKFEKAGLLKIIRGTVFY